MNRLCLDFYDFMMSSNSIHRGIVVVLVTGESIFKVKEYLNFLVYCEGVT
jgi:hypothetical protein